MQHANLQHGLFANSNGQHFLGGAGRSTQKICCDMFSCKNIFPK